MLELPHRRFSLRALAAMNRFVRREDIDVLHSHGRSGGVFARLSSIATQRRSVHTPHLPHQFGSAKSVFYWGMDLALSLQSRHLIAVSESEERSIRRNFGRRAGLSTIPNGVAVPDDPVSPENLRMRPLRVVHVTRFVPQKNSGLVLDVLEHLRRRGEPELFHVDVLGDGPERGPIEAEARSRGLGGAMTFHGTRPSIAAHVSLGFCLLSTSRSEGLPLAVLEAMAAGLPPVVTDVPGNCDLVNDRVGRVFPPSDPGAAASILLDLAGRPREWMELSSAARAEVRRSFSVGRMAAETLAVYREVLAGVPAAARRAKPTEHAADGLGCPRMLP